MAGAAFRCCGDVRCSLAHCLSPVVTTRAGPDHVVVVHGFRWSPSVGGVAIGAGITGIEMGRALASCAGAIVAAGTRPSSIRMVEIRWSPGVGRVTGAALRRGRNMLCRFAQRLATIMAA